MELANLLFKAQLLRHCLVMHQIIGDDHAHPQALD
jgi:hypothetical protein